MRRIALTLPALTVALILSACSTQAPAPDISAVPPPSPQLSEQERWQARVTTLSTMDGWRARGKVAYRLPEEAGSASLDWQQEGGQSDLRLSGPLGVGSTEISNAGALLRVQRDGIERLYPADAAPWLPGGALLPVPVASIQHWLRGVPDPALPVTRLEKSDALATHIEQAGWEIHYSEYEKFQGLDMPARMNLKAPRARLTLRLILRDWDY